jgi:hypothetical protein
VIHIFTKIKGANYVLDRNFMVPHLAGNDLFHLQGNSFPFEKV